MAKKRGRTSAAALSVLSFPDPSRIEGGERPAAPSTLPASAQAVWTRVVASLPADWFSEASWPVLEQYCRHVVEARRLSELIHRAIESPQLEIDAYDRLLKLQDDTQVESEPRPCTPRPHSTRASRIKRDVRALIGPSPLPSYGPTATASPHPR